MRYRVNLCADGWISRKSVEVDALTAQEAVLDGARLIHIEEVLEAGEEVALETTLLDAPPSAGPPRLWAPRRWTAKLRMIVEEVP